MSEVVKDSNKILFPTDPTRFGPGLWFSIHFKGIRATTEKKIACFIEYMDELSKNLPCMECRTHYQDYISKHPIIDYSDIKGKDGNPIGMFMWSWKFHNAVNLRLGKKHVDWDTAYNMFSSTESNFCSADCSSSGEEEPESETTSFSLVSDENHTQKPDPISYFRSKTRDSPIMTVVENPSYHTNKGYTLINGK